MVRHKAKPKYMFLWADRVDRGQKIIKAVRKIRNGGGGEGKGREGKGREGETFDGRGEREGERESSERGTLVIGGGKKTSVWMNRTELYWSKKELNSRSLKDKK